MQLNSSTAGLLKNWRINDTANGLFGRYLGDMNLLNIFHHTVSAILALIRGIQNSTGNLNRTFLEYSMTLKTLCKEKPPFNKKQLHTEGKREKRINLFI